MIPKELRDLYIGEVTEENGGLWYRYDFDSCCSRESWDKQCEATEELNEIGWDVKDTQLEHDCFTCRLVKKEKDLHNLRSFKDICSYYFDSLEGTSLNVVSLESNEWGVACKIQDKNNKTYVSFYLYPEHRGKNKYGTLAIASGLPIITSKSCDLEGYFKYKKIEYYLVENLD